MARFDFNSLSMRATKLMVCSKWIWKSQICWNINKLFLRCRGLFEKKRTRSEIGNILSKILTFRNICVAEFDSNIIRRLFSERLSAWEVSSSDNLSCLGSDVIESHACILVVIWHCICLLVSNLRVKNVALLLGQFNNAVNVMALVVAQSFEQQHSVQAGRVQIPAQAKLLGSELLFINTHWVSGFL